ncbi:hypothetical protein LEP1GSC151_4997 [Leptospira interrogans serovar Grippotyphosa str. LT2186]|uniref:Uncharacterized protein n=2 Tax=Leptospira interrogans TaxID=173 RepID=M3FZ19_LEPIR|nr:hypothetical protein LEP1GSC151_4997 [Leptospira interrogans serovar Grippotyphosa str. LT2186]EMY07093.1 hypothetical protein LEP1GSC029_0536 [Leptospira interrogans str. 2002000626]
MNVKKIEAKEPAKRSFKLSVSFLELNKTPPECRSLKTFSEFSKSRSIIN